LGLTATVRSSYLRNTTIPTFPVICVALAALDEWSALNIEAPRRRVSLALSSLVVIQPYVVGYTLVVVKFRN
jgi:hypothetical protein